MATAAVSSCPGQQRLGPDAGADNEQNPPLYLHITSTTKEGLDAAVAKVNEMIQQELPQLVDERRFRRRDQEPQEPERDRGDRGGDRDQGGRVSRCTPLLRGRELNPSKCSANGPRRGLRLIWNPCMDSISVLRLSATAARTSSISSKRLDVVSRSRAADLVISREQQIKKVTRICTSTWRKYTLQAPRINKQEHAKGPGSGPDAEMVEKGKSLCEDLVANVKQQYEEFKSRPPRYNDRGGHHGGDRYRGGSDRHHYDRGHSSYSGGGGGGYGSEHHTSTHSPAQGTDSPGQNAVDYSAAYAQYYGGADPYAAYGGYAK